MANEKGKSYDSMSAYEKAMADQAKSRTPEQNDRARDALAAKRAAEESAGRMRVGKRLDKKDSMTALRRLAEAKAGKKMSSGSMGKANFKKAFSEPIKKMSSVGKMLDKKEMSNDPRKPFMTKMKKSK